MVDFSANSKLIVFLLVAILSVDGLRFKQPAITASSDFLMVNVPARLTCNYLKYVSEKVREITWYAGYNGMEQKVLYYMYDNLFFEKFDHI